MNIHPLTSIEIARLHSDEKLARGLAAYAATRAQERPSARLDTGDDSAGRLHFVGRLRWRGAGGERGRRPAI